MGEDGRDEGDEAEEVVTRGKVGAKTSLHGGEKVDRNEKFEQAVKDNAFEEASNNRGDTDQSIVGRVGVAEPFSLVERDPFG